MISAHFAPQDGTSQVSSLGLEALGHPLLEVAARTHSRTLSVPWLWAKPPQTRAGHSSLGALGSAGSRREDGEPPAPTAPRAMIQIKPYGNGLE